MHTSKTRKTSEKEAAAKTYNRVVEPRKKKKYYSIFGIVLTFARTSEVTRSAT
jgi:hypothetical protein